MKFNTKLLLAAAICFCAPFVIAAQRSPATISGSGGGSGTVTSVQCGTGLSGGTITTTGVCAVAYGSSASTAVQGNDTRLSSAAAITGGTINGAVIGGVTPAAGTFTTLADAEGAIFSGTYTPTLTATTNVTATTPSAAFQYMRVGNMVIVGGMLNITPTAAGNTVVGISLPIASALTAISDASGTAGASAQTVANGNSATLFADAVNDRMNFKWQTVGFGSTVVWDCIFIYVIK